MGDNEILCRTADQIDVAKRSRTEAGQTTRAAIERLIEHLRGHPRIQHSSIPDATNHGSRIHVEVVDRVQGRWNGERDPSVPADVAKVGEAVQAAEE